MGKEIRPFCCHQNFVPNGLSAPAQGYIYIYMVKHEKNVYKTSKQFFLNLHQMGKVIWDFYWHQHLSPRGCLPLQWAIYMYKSITIYTRTSCQVSVYRTTGPLVFTYKSNVHMTKLSFNCHAIGFERYSAFFNS